MHEFEPVALWEAFGHLAKRLNVHRQRVLVSFVEAAGAKRIKVYGRPRFSGVGDRIRARIWRRVGRGEAQLCQSRGTKAIDLSNGDAKMWTGLYVFRGELDRLAQELTDDGSAVEPGTASANRSPTGKTDPRSKREVMIGGLETALSTGALAFGNRATLKAAYKAMLAALGHREVPAGMGEDAFAKHCKPWLKEHGIYG